MATVYIGKGVTELLGYFVVGMFLVHLFAAIASNFLGLPIYTQLTTAESMIVQNFLNWFFDVLRQIWHNFVSIFFGG